MSLGSSPPLKHEEPSPQFPDWWVYVLVSDTSGGTYVGVTTDLERRLEQHNGVLPGGAKRTTRGRPWKLAKKHGPCLDRSEAQTVEYELKRRRGAGRLSWNP